ncbi:hypothetical protein ACT7C1_33560 [Bacillus paranthracis]
MSYKIQKSQPFTISDLRKLEKKEKTNFSSTTYYSCSNGNGRIYNGGRSGHTWYASSKRC